jgi:hypothetical protein
MRAHGFYRVKVEERDGGSPDRHLRVLALRVYRDGVEAEALDFELSPLGARGLLDEVRWLEWKSASEGPSPQWQVGPSGTMTGR